MEAHLHPIGKPKIVPFRKSDAIGPTDDHWAQARAKAEASGIRFGALVCEDADGALFLVAVNVESDVHLESMIEKVYAVFTEEADG